MWKIAECRERDLHDVVNRTQEYAVDIFAWSSKKKKGEGKHVATVVLDIYGRRYLVPFKSKSKLLHNRYTKFQIHCAMGILSNIRNQRMPDYDKEYPYTR